VQLLPQSPLCSDDLLGQVIINKLQNHNGEVEYDLDGTPLGPIFSYPLFIPLSPQDYVIHFKDENNCQLTEHFTIPQAPQHSLALGEDQVVILGDQITITPLATFDIDRYQWASDAPILDCLDCPYLNLQARQSATYQLTASDEYGCEVRDEVSIFVKKEDHIFLPTAFSPNADGLNDTYRAHLGPSIQEVIIFQIADAEGRLMYQATNFAPNAAAVYWDGRFRGQLLQTATFIAFLEVLLIDSTVEQRVQTFNLMR